MPEFDRNSEGGNSETRDSEVRDSENRDSEGRENPHWDSLPETEISKTRDSEVRDSEDKDFRSRPGKPNQKKGQNEKFVNFAHFCQCLGCFSLGMQAIHIELLFKFAPGKSS